MFLENHQTSCYFPTIRKVCRMNNTLRIPYTHEIVSLDGRLSFLREVAIKRLRLFSITFITKCEIKKEITKQQYDTLNQNFKIKSIHRIASV